MTLRWLRMPLPTRIRRAGTPTSVPADHTLCDLLHADSLDDLTRIAFLSVPAALGLRRLLIIGWNGREISGWSVYPSEQSDSTLPGLMDEHVATFQQTPVGTKDDGGRRCLAEKLGFAAADVVMTRSNFTFHVCWSGGDRGSPPALTTSQLWRDLELGLCVYARLERLRELTHIDTLTGVFNRRYFNLRLLEEVARAKRFGRTLSLAITDLDRFKLLNDAHGHQAGDVVLRYLAQAVKKSVRAIDIVCRIGGDEFAILMPDTGQAECAALAQRLQRTVSASRFSLRGYDGDPAILDLRISVGAAVFPEHADRAERLLWHADMALLAAKKVGGDRFVVCDSSERQRDSGL